MPNDAIRAPGHDRVAARGGTHACDSVAASAVDESAAVVSDRFGDVFVAIEADTLATAATGFTDLAAAHFARTGAEQGRVAPADASPALARRFDEPLPLEGRPLADVLARLAADVVPNAIALHHPMYMGHQVSAPLPAAVWTEALVGALNQSMPVAEMSPAMTAIEHRVVRWMCDLAGLDGPRAGGTFTSGGTEATFAALLAARSALMPDVWRDGVAVAAGGAAPVILCGEHAHYAVARAAGEMGLGLRSVQLVPSRDFRMDVSALGTQVAALRVARTPILAVVATAGSTATGSFDDLSAVADICDAHGLWLHVDGAHGASALLSDRDRDRLRGIGRARSIAWDPHKMMLLPLSAGVVLVRDERDLEAAFAQAAPYLFHGTDGDATQRGWDTGVRSFQCSRRADALKAWVALQRYGAAGIGRVYDRLCDTTRALHALIEQHPAFVALHAPESNILCFRWTGSHPERSHPERSHPERSHPERSHPERSEGEGDAFLDAVNRETRERYNRSGAGWITATVLGGRRVLRVTVMNPRTTARHAERLLDGLAATALEVARELQR